MRWVEDFAEAPQQTVEVAEIRTMQEAEVERMQAI
jgi:hypothetical protein